MILPNPVNSKFLITLSDGQQNQNKILRKTQQSKWRLDTVVLFWKRSHNWSKTNLNTWNSEIWNHYIVLLYFTKSWCFTKSFLISYSRQNLIYDYETKTGLHAHCASIVAASEPNFFSTDAIVRKLKEVSAIENNSTKYLSKYILAVLAQFLVCQTFNTMVEFSK